MSSSGPSEQQEPPPTLDRGKGVDREHEDPTSQTAGPSTQAQPSPGPRRSQRNRKRRSPRPPRVGAATTSSPDKALIAELRATIRRLTKSMEQQSGMPAIPLQTGNATAQHEDPTSIPRARTSRSEQNRTTTDPPSIQQERNQSEPVPTIEGTRSAPLASSRYDPSAHSNSDASSSSDDEDHSDDGSEGPYRDHSAPPPRSKRKLSELTPKITPLDDGSDPSFKQWNASVRDRLELNHDHYPTERSRKAFVWGVTEGRAKGYLEPRYLSRTKPFKDAQSKIRLLKSYFVSGTETETARDEFGRLRMFPSESFPDFKARFLDTAIKGSVSKSEWFYYMWNKITPELKSIATPVKLGWENKFSRMVTHLTSIDADNRPKYSSRNNKSSKKAVSWSENDSAETTRTRSRSPRRSYNSRTSFARSPSPSPRRLAIFEQTKTRAPFTPVKDSPKADGNCYNCGKPGHWAQDCRSPPAVKEIDGPDVVPVQQEKE